MNKQTSQPDTTTRGTSGQTETTTMQQALILARQLQEFAISERHEQAKVTAGNLVSLLEQQS